MQLEVKGKIINIDESDLELFDKHTWCIHEGYVTTNIKKEKGYKTELLHRLIMKPKKGLQVDHINGDRLDNRRGNLRVCTPAENKRNKTRVLAKSGLKGVYAHRDKKKWVSRITTNRKTRHLGLFNTKQEAAEAYDMEAIRCFGQFACTNF